MTPLDVITLDEAKDFLKVDYPDENTIIEGMIKAAIAMVEKRTGYRLYDRAESMPIDRKTDVYVYPFSVTSIADKYGNVIDEDSYTVEQKTLRSTVSAPYCFAGMMTMAVGYTDRGDIPADLLEACRKIITYLYQNRDNYQADIPSDVQMILQPYVRWAGI